MHSASATVSPVKASRLSIVGHTLSLLTAYSIDPGTGLTMISGSES